MGIEIVLDEILSFSSSIKSRPLSLWEYFDVDVQVDDPHAYFGTACTSPQEIKYWASSGDNEARYKGMSAGPGIASPHKKSNPDTTHTATVKAGKNLSMAGKNLGKYVIEVRT